MNKFILLLLLILPHYVFSHLCHDPFRPRQHLVVVPEKKVITVEEEGSFRVYIENTFDCILNDVKLLVESEAFKVEVQPSSIQKLVPGERSFFLVNLRLREGFQTGSYPLNIKVEARSSELTPSVDKIDVIVEKTIQKEQQQEIQQLSQHSITALTQQLSTTRTNISSESTLPTEQKQQQKVVEGYQEIIAKVEKRPLWKTSYFYIVLISAIIIIFLLRKIKLR